MRKISVPNCMVRPLKIVSMFMWPIHRKCKFLQVLKYIMSDEDLENIRCFNNFRLHRASDLHPWLIYFTLKALNTRIIYNSAFNHITGINDLFSSLLLPTMTFANGTIYHLDSIGTVNYYIITSIIGLLYI